MPKKRDAGRKSPNPRLHIFCEGEKTEPNYLRGYVEGKFPGTRLSPVRQTSKNTPVQLVEEAIKEKGNNPSGDLFWVVFDREAENKYADALHNEARTKAKAAGVNIAFSNVCFEVWILLHFQTNVATYSSYSDLLKQSSLKTHIKDYDKGKKRLFTETEISTARRNAEALNKRTKVGADPAWRHPYQWNPYTDVYKLLDAIDGFGRKYIH
ncbi:MAG: RloB family protein [Thermodesulfobacteriota bacterium]|nr:RloB family protein [Thermodesulfobacteriota bacterium]